MTRGWDMGSVRATILAFFLPASSLTLVAFAVVGQIPSDVLIMSAAAAPAVATGILVGSRLRRRLDPERFRALVAVLLVMTGCAVLAGSVARLAGAGGGYQ